MNRFENKIDRTEKTLVCGNVADEIKEQSMAEEAVGGDNSQAKGNDGVACSLTNECQAICGIVNYSGWGPWCN